MIFKPFLAAVALGVALSGTGYACDQVQKDTTNQAANAAYRQFAPPNENQGGITSSSRTAIRATTRAPTAWLLVSDHALTG